MINSARMTAVKRARSVLLLFFVIVLPARGQEIDSLWGLRHVRSFTDAHKTELLIPLTAGTVAAQGYLHGAFYSRGEYADIHLASEILGALHFSTAYVAGLDPLEAYGATMIGTFVFQMAINASVGYPLVNPRERRHYEAGGMDLSFKRVFVGYGRWAQLGIGVVLVLYKPLVRIVRRTIW